MNAVNLVIKRFLLTTLFFKNFLSEFKHCLISLYRKIIFKLQTRYKLLISYNSSPYFDNHFPSLAFQSHDHALIIFFTFLSLILLEFYYHLSFFSALGNIIFAINEQSLRKQSGFIPLKVQSRFFDIKSRFHASYPCMKVNFTKTVYF